MAFPRFGYAPDGSWQAEAQESGRLDRCCSDKFGVCPSKPPLE
jgi:hypothetical protein